MVVRSRDRTAYTTTDENRWKSRGAEFISPRNVPLFANVSNSVVSLIIVEIKDATHFLRKRIRETCTNNRIRNQRYRAYVLKYTCIRIIGVFTGEGGSFIVFIGRIEVFILSLPID